MEHSVRFNRSPKATFLHSVCEAKRREKFGHEKGTKRKIGIE